MKRALAWLTALLLLAHANAHGQRASAQDAQADASGDAGATAAPDAWGDGGFDLEQEIAEGAAMTADRAADRAAERAPQLDRAEALLRAAEAAVARTRDQLLPRLELSARYAHIDGFPDGRIELARDPQALAAARALAAQNQDPASRALWQANLEQSTTRKIEIPRDQVAFSARVSWPVSDLFFSIAPAIDAARASQRVSEAQRTARIARVRLSARETYYQLARARGALAVTRRAVEQAAAQKARIDAAVAAGLRAPADAASATARVAMAEQAVAAAEAAVDVADAALRTLLADDEGAPYGIAEALDEELPGEERPVTTLIAQARARRAEVIALREALHAQRKLARVAAAGGYPHLGLFAGADYAMPNRYVIPPTSEFKPSWEVGALLSYVPNDTLSASRRGRESRAQIDALEADLEELERGLLLEVRTARAASARAGRTIAAARATERATEQAYAQRVAELRAGEVTLADLFAAESELNRARLDRLDAMVEQRLARARLAYAIGE